MNTQKKEKYLRDCFMQVDYALILSAGFGTRMGEIGKQIPKVMWPIFEKKLIDLQICYCRDLGVNQIFINTHYLSDAIENHIKKNYGNEIVILNELPLLDSGGAIHNMAAQKNVNYTGNVLMVNGDQFLFFDKKLIKKALELLEFNRAVLFGIEVEKNSNYNETKTENGKLISIEKPSKLENFITYSGLGILKLDRLTKTPGISKFFSTVIDYKNESTYMLTPESEYWDFGTAEIYYKNILKILEAQNETSQMVQFLKKHNCINGSQELFISKKLKSINLNYQGLFSENAIVYNEIIQSIY